MESGATIVIVKKKVIDKKMLMIFIALGVAIIIGMVIQFRMTFNREQFRSLDADAVDASRAIGNAVESVKPAFSPVGALLGNIKERVSGMFSQSTQ